jgi:S-DNA-T family DNA segregation ATPase FtsK/SpoIIIE
LPFFLLYFFFLILYIVAMEKKRTTKSKKAPEKKAATQPALKQLHPELRGLLLLSLVVVLFLSQVSFAYLPDTTNWFGLIGHSIGWICHSLFGLSSYLICLFLGWAGWRLLLSKPIEHPAIKVFFMSIAVGSLCILLSLAEDASPTLKNLLGNTFYPALYSLKQRYHLGGAPFFFLYKDLPFFNLYHLLNSVGIALIFSSTLLASMLFLTGMSLLQMLGGMKRLLTPKEKAPVEEAPEEPEEKDDTRYVKLRIPEGPPNLNSTINDQASANQGLLAIKPETNLTSRPSLSRKETPEKEPLENRSSIEKSIEKALAPKKQPPAESKRDAALKAQKVHNGDFTNYALPPLTLLTIAKKVDQSSIKKDLRKQAEVLEETLQSFGIEAKVGQINCGPTINSFEVHPAIGVKVQKIKALENDIALNMEAKSIRIIAPIPGKAAVGIEVPNPQPQEVGFRDMLAAYQQAGSKFHIPVLLGKAVTGDYVMSDLTKMPHCIIAGATGSGKSVCINTIIMAILLNAKPDQVKLLMVDPKKVELTPYSKLPHMLAPVITEPRGACSALNWLVKEMENRYEILKQLGVRNIEGFNNRTVNKALEDSLDREIPDRMPYLVAIIDELADLMMVASSDIETPIARIAQMARAVGIHLILATQRPSREVITGLIKANFPTRIAFKVASRVNSQIILDEVGAESLLGNGDMLFLPPGSSTLMRAQGAFIRDEDINTVINFIGNQAPPNYVIQSFDAMAQTQLEDEGAPAESSGDTLYDQALDIVRSTGNASTTFLQRKLKVGYARAASLIDQLEARGIVSPPDGSRPRKVLVAHPKALSEEKEDEALFSTDQP